LKVKESYEGRGRRKTIRSIKKEDWRGTEIRQERRYDKKGISN
jgi:hypothetical protein